MAKLYYSTYICQLWSGDSNQISEKAIKGLMMGYRPIKKLQTKHNITMNYDCKYSEGDYSLAEIQGDASVFTLGYVVPLHSLSAQSGLLCHYFYTLNLAENCTRKLTYMGEIPFK